MIFCRLLVDLPPIFKSYSASLIFFLPNSNFTVSQMVIGIVSLYKRDNISVFMLSLDKEITLLQQ